MVAHDGGSVEIAPVDDDGKFEGAVEALEIERGKLLPLGENDDGIGPLGSGVRIGCEGERVRGGKNTLGAFDGGRIEGGDGDAGVEQATDERNGRRIARIVGIGFEGKTESGYLFAAQGPERGADLLDSHASIGMGLPGLGELTP